MSTNPQRVPSTALVMIAAVVSWLGLYLHNVADLPGQTLLSPESALPAVVLLLPAGVWFTRYRRLAAGLFQGWVWLHLVGGAILSVLPLPILPFRPEQSLHHYAFHVVYGLAQVPLLITTIRYLRRTRLIELTPRSSRAVEDR
jgi:hypothetical protein